MSFRVVALQVAFGALVATCGCNSTVQTEDQTWVVSYRVENRTSVDLVLNTSGMVNAVDTLVESRESIEFGDYEWFLGPKPSIDRDIWCISVSRASDREIVAQSSPATSGQWEVEKLARYSRRYTLVVSDGDLGEVSNLCARFGLCREECCFPQSL